MREDIEEYYLEKEAHIKRVAAYATKIQERTQNSTSQIINQLVEERHRQSMTQQELADITGILPSNLARFESGNRIPTLLVLQKYASALGKRIELSLVDEGMNE